MAGRTGDEAETVRGIAAHAPSRRVYVSTTKRLAAIDLETDRIVWEKSYDGHCCERMAISPDGETIYAPAFGSPRWFVVHAATGELRASIGVTGWPRATIYSRDGRYVFLGAWDSPVLSVADTARHEVVRTIGPFGGSVCPFTVNGRNTLVFANVDGLVGFEVGDLQTGLILDRVAVDGYDKARRGALRMPQPRHRVHARRARAVGGGRCPESDKRVRCRGLPAGAARGDRAVRAATGDYIQRRRPICLCINR